MKRVFGCLLIVVCFLAVTGWTSEAVAQEKKPGRNIVSMYQVSAGKHVEFLKWMARQEAVTKEAGGSATQWYVHQDGASWDFVAITPELEPAKQAEVDKKVEAIAKQKGLSTGLKASFEFRQYMGTHSDTYALGPMTADEIVKAAEK
ncbi:MAG: hypothetical protein ACXWFQ_03175 [Thermoanaerobaculia bacterium]